MRRVAWLLLLWQAFWLNVFIPGHTRGAITLPGTSTTCCGEEEATPSCCRKHDDATKKRQPTEEQKRRCAVCYFVAGYTVAVAFVIDLRLSRTPIERVAVETAQVVSRTFDFPFYPNGPPASLA